MFRPRVPIGKIFQNFLRWSAVDLIFAVVLGFFLVLVFFFQIFGRNFPYFRKIFPGCLFFAVVLEFFFVFGVFFEKIFLIRKKFFWSGVAKSLFF